MPKFVVRYESAADVASRAPAVFPAHEAWYRRFADDGTLLMIGIFADPQAEGAMAVFTTREAAEAFVAGDPFVTEGVVARWHVLEWREVLTGE
ncbi:MAG TPA: YciI family protein [Acidimicrobiales bacterium]